jgi:hypothetical protein
MYWGGGGQLFALPRLSHGQRPALFEHHRCQNCEDMRRTRSTPALLHNSWHSNLWCAQTWIIATDYQSESSTLKESWPSPTCFIPADHFRRKVLFTRFTLVDSTALIIQSDPCKRSLSLAVWACEFLVITVAVKWNKVAEFSFCCCWYCCVGQTTCLLTIFKAGDQESDYG